MAIKKIVLGEDICSKLSLFFMAAGIGWCPNNEQFITLHGRKILIDQADEESIKGRNEIVARALSSAVDVKEYLGYQAVFATMFQNISGASSPVDNHTLTMRFPTDARDSAIERLRVCLDMPEEYKKTHLETAEGQVYSETIARTGGMFGRIAITHKDGGKFVTNITYNAVTRESITTTAIDSDEARTVDRIVSVDNVDVLMIEYSMDLKELTLTDKEDKLSDSLVLSCFNIPYFGNSEELKTESTKISKGSIYKRWIEELLYAEASGLIRRRDVIDPSESDSEVTGAIRVTKSPTRDEIDRAVLFTTTIVDKNGSIWSRLKTHNASTVLYQPNGCKLMHAWFNQIAGLDISIAIVPTGFIDRYAVKAGLDIAISPTLGKADAVRHRLIDLIRKVILDLGQEVSSIKFKQLITGPGSANIHLADFSCLNDILALVRDRVNKALEDTDLSDKISRLKITKESVNSFKTSYSEDISFINDHRLNCLHAMRSVWRLLDIPNMPGDEGDFFRKLEETETFEEAVELLEAQVEKDKGIQ